MAYTVTVTIDDTIDTWTDNVVITSDAEDAALTDELALAIDDCKAVVMRALINDKT